MIKFLIFVLLVYLAYRLIAGKPLIGSGPKQQIRDQEPDNGGYTDYEEVE